MGDFSSASAKLRSVFQIGIGQIFAWGSSFYLLAILATPITRDTGWKLEFVVAGLSVGLMTAGLVSPLVGRGIARYGGHWVLALSSIIFALGLTVMASAGNLTTFLLSWIVIGCAMGAGLYDAAFATLGQLFGAKARAAITSLTVIAGFSSTLCWPLSQWLVDNLSWRGACLVYAAIHLSVCLLAYLGLPRAPLERAEKSAPNPAAAFRPDNERPIILILIALIWIISGIVTVAVSVHLFVALAARDIEPATLLLAGTLIGPAQVVGRLAEYALLRRHHPVWTLGLASALTTMGLLLVIAASALLIPGILLYGAGTGISWVARGTLPLALFGTERYPIILGRLAAPNLLAQAATPPLTAMLIDIMGGPMMLSMIAVLSGLGLVFAIVLVKQLGHHIHPSPI